MQHVTAHRNPAPAPKSFGIRTSAAPSSKPRSFCTYKTASYLHIPQLLKAVYFQVLTVKMSLTLLECADAKRGGRAAPMFDGKRAAPSCPSLARHSGVEGRLVSPRQSPACLPKPGVGGSRVTSHSSLAHFNHTRLKSTAILQKQTLEVRSVALQTIARSWDRQCRREAMFGQGRATSAAGKPRRSGLPWD